MLNSNCSKATTRANNNISLTTRFHHQTKAKKAQSVAGDPTEVFFGDMPTVEDVREEDFFHTSTHFFNCA